MKKFRLLRADEIEARIQQVNVSKNGCVVLLYKDARCDMNILDETFGCENWQRNHVVINDNLFCNVGIKLNDEWIWKQDVGTESNTEKEKGQASDSFKRACFNWGIGRELYSSPFIWINLKSNEIKDGKCYTKFYVKEIGYNDNEEIKHLVIVDGNGEIRFTTKQDNTPKQEAPKQDTPKPKNNSTYRNKLVEFCQVMGFDMKDIAKKYNINGASSDAEFKKVCDALGVE